MPVMLSAFQRAVRGWCLTCFGEEVADDIRERNHRFLEEALELVQSLGGTAEEAHELVDYVFGRPAGEPFQEIGGVEVTLAALCSAARQDLDRAAWNELMRISEHDIMNRIRQKHRTKPMASPLPGGVQENCYGN